MLNLKVIVASTRPGRKGPIVAKWVYEFADAQHDKFNVNLIDLADLNLPVFDEAAHPTLKKYEHEVTKQWSESVDSADAFVFVMPEYDHGIAPSLLNAMIYLYHEWSYKPVAFVSYGGMSGGLRAVQMAHQVVVSFKMVPILEGVTLTYFTKNIDEAGVFVPNEAHDKSALVMLDELARWATALKPMRG